VNPQSLDFSSWIGRSEIAVDTLGPTPAAALAATLDHPPQRFELGDVLAPLWHWLYFLPLHRQSEIGSDGHPRRGGFLPPVPLPRRMWAGSQFEFRSPLRLGDVVQRQSSIVDASVKQGRSGALVFLKLCHELRRQGADEPALVEFHDIVYRDAPGAGDPAPPAQPAPAPGRWQRRIEPDPVLLFRYSALTFNGHRIHYDRRYVTEVEGYPGLVVHGPLIATLLLDLLTCEQPGVRLSAFSFKALRPTFDLHAFQVHGEPQADGRSVRLWATDHEGALTMDAQATLA
jgi:3-methylfumaryl-CoA hydratase